MPSGGTVAAMIVHDQIDKAIKQTFVGRAQEDAYTLWRLSLKGGSSYPELFAGFGAFMTALFVISHRATPVTTAFVAGVSLIATAITFSRRQKARRAFQALLASDPGRWQPISISLQAIVRSAGGKIAS